MKTEKEHIKNIKFYKSILKNKYLSYIIVPTVIFSSSLIATKILKTPTMEYQTINHTIDGSTGKILSEVSSFEETPSEHTLKVLEYRPWKKFSEGDYRREIVVYDYDIETLLEKGYPIDSLDLENSRLKKDQYIEQKEELSLEDNTEETIIIIEESFQDKTKKRIRKEYWVPLVTAGTILSIILNYLIHNDISIDYKDSEEIKVLKK